MRLQVNLIPALAYALVMLFSEMTGMSVTTEQPSKKQQAVSLPASPQELYQQNNYVWVAKNGLLILSNGFAKGNLEWKIPYKPETSVVLL